MEEIRPTTEKDVRDAVSWAAAADRPIELAGGGTKRGLGRPAAAEAALRLDGLDRIALYEPEELVLTAEPGARLSEIGARLDQHGQCLAFEPPDLGPLLGAAAGGATLGGVLASNLSGPRRPKAGAARDHILGLRGVSGRGEIFKSGGRVVKNVTGYDMPKLLAGSYGTLAAMTEVTVKVLPAAETVRTVLIGGLDDRAAAAAMGRALSGPCDPSAAAHLPAAVAPLSSVAGVRALGGAVTALRIEGPRPSAEQRSAALRAAIGPGHPTEELRGRDSRRLWREIADVAYFVAPADRFVWRLSVPPAEGARTVATVAAALAVEAFYDWGGGLIWLAVDGAARDAGAAGIRAAIAPGGGHATLIRAPEAVRRRTAVFQPQPPALAALGARVKRAFDPRAVLNRGRMYEDA